MFPSRPLPTLMAAAAATALAVNSSTTSLWTMARLVAVHFWPVDHMAPMIDKVDRLVEVGVLEDDDRVLAAHLALGLAAAAGDLAVDAAADRVGAGEGDAFDHGVAGDLVADHRAGAGDEIEHTRRQARLPPAP